MRDMDAIDRDAFDEALEKGYKELCNRVDPETLSSDAVMGFVFDTLNRAKHVSAADLAEHENPWIQVSSPNDLPKDRVLTVTDICGRVDELYWDMTEWSDNWLAKNTVAYKFYVRPEPYQGPYPEI